MVGMGYDAAILVSFGGPEGPDEVMPFLRHVVRGRSVPDDRLAIVAQHYQHLGGVSPINEQCRCLLAALRAEFNAAGLDLPWYWGNRHWHPFLAEAVAQMRDDGVARALAFVTSPFGSLSSCRQYLDDIAAARAFVGAGAPVIDKLRHYHDHPGLVACHVDAVRRALAQLSLVEELSLVDSGAARLVFTAHSIPESMDHHSGPSGGRYSAQLSETAALVAVRAWPGGSWDLAWQSRSGSPRTPWLGPDINDHLEALAAAGVGGVVVSPIGFVSDHMEVVWDLDVEAAATARRLGLGFARAATPGTDPRFVAMVHQLVAERLDSTAPRERLGELPVWDTCPTTCCLGEAQQAGVAEHRR
jgi:protoporphyrin/coproporphyrin ferrochelatase